MWLLQLFLGDETTFVEHAFNILQELKELYPQISIKKCGTFFNIRKKHGDNGRVLEFNTIIDQCDVLICYVNEDRKMDEYSKYLKYARENGLKIINLYEEEDDFWDFMGKEFSFGFYIK